MKPGRELQHEARGVALMPYAQPRRVAQEKGLDKGCAAAVPHDEAALGPRARRRVVTSHHQATKQSSEMASYRYASPRYCRAGWSQLA
jgi:hypothetical protein